MPILVDPDSSRRFSLVCAILLPLREVHVVLSKKRKHDECTDLWGIAHHVQVHSRSRRKVRDRGLGFI